MSTKYTAKKPALKKSSKKVTPKKVTSHSSPAAAKAVSIGGKTPSEKPENTRQTTSSATQGKPARPKTYSDEMYNARRRVRRAIERGKAQHKDTSYMESLVDNSYGKDALSSVGSLNAAYDKFKRNEADNKQWVKFSKNDPVAAKIFYQQTVDIWFKQSIKPGDRNEAIKNYFKVDTMQEAFEKIRQDTLEYTQGEFDITDEDMFETDQERYEYAGENVWLEYYE